MINRLKTLPYIVPKKQRYKMNEIIRDIDEIIKEDLRIWQEELRETYDIIPYSKDAVIFKYKKVNNYKEYRRKLFSVKMNNFYRDRYDVAIFSLN